jgi:hypothetical protein
LKNNVCCVQLTLFHFSPLTETFMCLHNLHTLNAIPPIYDVFLSCLSPGSRARYSRSCSSANIAVADFNRRAYNVNRHLSRFFVNPFEFRAIQAHSGALISGSNALQFLDRIYYENSDLDLYVEDKNREEVGVYLQKEGYRFMPHEKQKPSFESPAYQSCETTGFVHRSTDDEIYGMRGVSGVYNFVKEGFPELKVQLISAVRSPLEVILSFHSSEFGFLFA